MKASEIKVGGLYVAKVSLKLTTVRVDEIREVYFPTLRKIVTRYDITNLMTNRSTSFRSAAKFRSAVPTTAMLRQIELDRICK